MESQQTVEETEDDIVKSSVPVSTQMETESQQTIEESEDDIVKSSVPASTQMETESQQTIEESEDDIVKSSVPAPIKMKIQQIVEEIEDDQLKSDLPVISIGDTVKVGVLIQEGNKQRVQPYEGTLIAQHRARMNSTITVRRIFQGVGVERVFTLHSPFLKNIEITRRAKVRKAKLYYLRDRVGKATRLKQKNVTSN